jgi:hypothetical protein
VDSKEPGAAVVLTTSLSYSGSVKALRQMALAILAGRSNRSQSNRGKVPRARYATPKGEGVDLLVGESFVGRHGDQVDAMLILCEPTHAAAPIISSPAYT